MDFEKYRSKLDSFSMKNLKRAMVAIGVRNRKFVINSSNLDKYHNIYMRLLIINREYRLRLSKQKERL